jgi:hypothetical protein
MPKVSRETGKHKLVMHVHHTLPPVVEKVHTKLMDVDPRKLKATQEDLVPGTVSAYKKNPERNKQPPFILKAGDKMFISDGHHRARAAVLTGKPTIKANVYDMGAAAAAGREHRERTGQKLHPQEHMRLAAEELYKKNFKD